MLLVVAVTLEPMLVNALKHTAMITRLMANLKTVPSVIVMAVYP